MLYEINGARYWLIQKGQTYQSKIEIILVYVPSEELVAGMLTKATTGAKFKYLRDKLLGTRDGDMAYSHNTQ